MTDDERRRALEAIASEVAVCTRCRLHETRTRAVPGEGNPETEVMFVGEGPGFNEDRQGRPFVGQAGALLGELLSSVGWRRDEVFITNVVKCRPPGNRDPEPAEIAACAPYLTRQIEALDPALVVTLGRFSMARFAPGSRIGQVHGTFRRADPGSGAPDAFTFAMYHPAAALHQGSLKETLFADMQGVPRALVAAREARETPTAEDSGASDAVDEPAPPPELAAVEEAARGAQHPPAEPREIGQNGESPTGDNRGDESDQERPSIEAAVPVEAAITPVANERSASPDSATATTPAPDPPAAESRAVESPVAETPAPFVGGSGAPGNGVPENGVPEDGSPVTRSAPDVAAGGANGEPPRSNPVPVPSSPAATVTPAAEGSDGTEPDPLAQLTLF